jgi:hypothetical protein
LRLDVAGLDVSSIHRGTCLSNSWVLKAKTIVLKYRCNTVLACYYVRLLKLGSKCSVIAGTSVLNEGYSNSPKGHDVGIIADRMLMSSPIKFYCAEDYRKTGIVLSKPSTKLHNN